MCCCVYLIPLLDTHTHIHAHTHTHCTDTCTHCKDTRMHTHQYSYTHLQCWYAKINSHTLQNPHCTVPKKGNSLPGKQKQTVSWEDQRITLPLTTELWTYCTVSVCISPYAQKEMHMNEGSAAEQTSMFSMHRVQERRRSPAAWVFNTLQSFSCLW
jgi:hypothetical protein